MSSHMHQAFRNRYNANVFAVEPKDHIIPLTSDVDDISLLHDSYKVYNIGRADVCVGLLYGTSKNWERVVEENTIKPGQTLIFDNVGKLFIVSGIRISNNTDVRAIVHCSQAGYRFPADVDEKPGVPDRGYNDNLRETYSLGVRYIPYMDAKYRGLYEAFWPLNECNAWEEILLKLQPLLEGDVYQAVSVTVNEYMESIRHKLDIVSKNYDKGQPTSRLYMEIARDLLEFEKELIYGKGDPYNTINMLLLPLFSTFVLLKTIFYALGITTFSDIGLSLDNLSHIENYLNKSREAIKYIDKMLHYSLENAYNTSHPEDLFNSMMNVRSYVAIHGIEFTRLWDNIAKCPFVGGNIFAEVISYSNFFGRPTASLIREATSEKMYPPLTPRYIGFIFNYLTLIEVHLWSDRSSSGKPKVGGMRIVFADHSSYLMGTKTEVIEQIDFLQAYIAKLQVTGRGSVDSCTFYMSDGRTLCFGTREEDTEEETFELKGHRIVSIFLSSDDDSLEGQAANIAVSYQLNI